MSVHRSEQLVEAGMWLQTSGDLEGARKLFQQALELNPENAKARELLEGKGDANPLAPVTKTNLFQTDWASATGMEPDVPTTKTDQLPLDPSSEEPTDLFAFGAASDAPPVEDLSDLNVPPAPEVPTLVFGAPEGQTVTAPIEFELSFDEAPSPPKPVPPAQLDEPLTRPEGQTVTTRVELDLSLDELPPPPAPPARSTVVATPMIGSSAWDTPSNPGVHLSALSGAAGDAMDLVAPPKPVRGKSPEEIRDEVETLLRGVKDMIELDDHSGATDLLARAEALAPGDPAVAAFRQKSERTLEAMYESKLGPLAKKPRVKLKEDEIIWLNLDHRAGFVLAQIDGMVSFEDLFEVCGMSRLDTARILAQLVEQGVIAP